jgi:signal transduction histidine kinase
MTAASSSFSVTGATVYLAEDDAPASAVLCAVLGRAGYQVRLAPDGPSVLRLIEEHGPPDVLLLDWMLPGMSGLEVCHRVRQRWDAVALPILLVTAKADAESISAAFDAGASDYITKPFLGAELRSRVSAHLRLKRTMEERVRMEEHLRERDKLSALGLLVSGVAHDLNNPLTGIAGYTQLLLRTEPDEARAQDLRHILSDVERCRRIVRHLLGFARRQPVEPTAIDLREVLRSTFELRDRHLRACGVRACFSLADEVPFVLADAQQMQQVFLNVLLNAEQALRNRGGVLEITLSVLEPELTHVDFDGVPTGEWLMVEFYNDGPPIPPDVLPHIFDPFFTTKPKEEGTGLGLAICQRIVREHGGEIVAESTADGTRFRIRLPALQPAAVPSAGA